MIPQGCEIFSSPGEIPLSNNIASKYIKQNTESITRRNRQTPNPGGKF